MTSASAIRAGNVFVEIAADDTKFQAAVKRVHNRMAAMSQTLRQTGTALALGGAAIGLPMVLAARQAAQFEDALLELQGSVSDISPKQLKAVRDESLRLSKAMGVAPEKIAQAFALLVKAGMSVEDAIGGAAKSAVEFARVSGVEAAQAAEFMKVSMNVFGISAKDAADTLSAAADSSETSIAAMIESFALVASVAKGTNQSLFGLSQGLAVLARYGIKGEEAGTGIKTFLVKLLSPAEDARKALASLGLSMESFVDESGKMLPLSQIAEVFADRMKGMDKSARDAMLTNEALVKVFDVRGIRVIQAFADAGKEGFSQIAAAMESSRSVSEKFAIMMKGITGSLEVMQSAVKRLAIAFGTGLSPALAVAADAIAWTIDRLSWLLERIPILSPILATLAAVAVGLGVAMVSVWWALTAVNFGIRGFLKAGPMFAAVTAMMSRAAVGLTASLTALRAAFFAMPLIGQIAAVLAGGAAIGAGIAWMMSGSKEKPRAAAKKGGIKRDEFRQALEEPMAAGPEKPGRGDTLATFASSIAGQLGIGPKLGAEAKIADATSRTADGVEQLVAMGRPAATGGRAVPPASTLARGVRGPSPAVGGVAANADRDLVSVAERTAIATEKAAALLREILNTQPSGGMAFA